MNAKKCRSNSYICTRNVQTMQTCTKFRLKTAWNLKYMFFVHTNYTKPIQLANWNDLCMFFVHTNNVKTIQKPVQLANWNSLCMFFRHTNNVQTIQKVYKC